MSGVVIGGRQYDVPGVNVVSWLDDTVLRLKIGEDGRKRKTTWIRGITLHSTRGFPDPSYSRPQSIIPGIGPDEGQYMQIIARWGVDGLHAGSHLIVDYTGLVACCADLQTEVSYHAEQVNEVTIGIEVCQTGRSAFYQCQMDALVLLVDFLTKQFGIQRQCSWPYKNNQIVPRIAAGGADVVGIYGHRDVTTNRSFGDPGDYMFEALMSAGYESFDFSKDADKATWQLRQANLKINPPDGVPGPKTVAALNTAGYKNGLWTPRPND